MLRFLTTLLIIASLTEAAVCQPLYSYRVSNFVVYAGNPRLARDVAIAAERHLERLLIEWFQNKGFLAFGQIEIRALEGGPNRARSSRGRVIVEVDANHQDLLNGVLPHEIMHVLLRAHFGNAIPAWLNEGLACAAEDGRARIRRFESSLKFLEYKFLSISELSGLEGGSFNRRDIYVHGIEATKFLLMLGGRERMLDFLSFALKSSSSKRWEEAAKLYYGKSLSQLDRELFIWLKQQKEFARPLNRI